jgi:hypothetical protein
MVGGEDIGTGAADMREDVGGADGRVLRCCCIQVEVLREGYSRFVLLFLFSLVKGCLTYDSKNPRSDIGESEGARSWYKR